MSAFRIIAVPFNNRIDNYRLNEPAQTNCHFTSNFFSFDFFSFVRSFRVTISRSYFTQNFPGQKSCQSLFVYQFNSSFDKWKPFECHTCKHSANKKKIGCIHWHFVLSPQRNHPFFFSFRFRFRRHFVRIWQCGKGVKHDHMDQLIGTLIIWN